MIIYGSNHRKSRYYGGEQVVPTKTCTRCGETKVDTEFRRVNTYGSTIRVPVCKECELDGPYEDVRVCNKCGLPKQLNEYYASRTICTACYNESKHQYRVPKKRGKNVGF